MSTNKAVFFILCALICTTCSAYAAVEQLSSKWAAAVDEEIRALGTGDINGDNVSEIIAATPKKVYVYNVDGKQIKSYPVDFPISVMHVADVDGDGMGEILLGSGSVKTTNLSVERFDFTDKDDIHEKPEVLYMITRNLGDVYLIEYDAKAPVKWLEVGEWVRDINSQDLNGDNIPELLVASGGSNVDYIEKITTGIDPITNNKTYIRNYTESHYENGSILVFLSNRTLAVSYRTNNLLWYVYPTYLQKASGTAILSGSTDISLWTINGTILSSFKSLDKTYAIKNVFSDKVSGGKASEFLVWFASPAVEGAYLLDLEGIMLWQYRSPSKNLRGVYSLNLDIDAGKEVVLVAQQNIYVLNGEGKLEWSYVLPAPIDRSVVTELGENMYTDFVFSSGKNIYVYETSERFIKAQLASAYYQGARDNYETGKYPEALINLTSAKDIYSQLSDSEGVTACDSLFQTINSSVKGVRKDTALAMYKKARSEYYLGKYAEAKEYLLKAKDIYFEASDLEGVSRCEEFLNELEGDAGTLASSTTLPPEEQTTVPEYDPYTTEPAESGNKVQSPLILGLAGLILVLLIGFGIKQMKERKALKKEKQPKKNDKKGLQKDPMEEISVAVGRDGSKDSSGVGPNSKDGSTEAPSETEAKIAPLQSNAIPLGYDVTDKKDQAASVIEKKVESAAPPVEKTPSAEQKTGAGSKAIPLGYGEEPKKKEKPKEEVIERDME